MKSLKKHKYSILGGLVLGSYIGHEVTRFFLEKIELSDDLKAILLILGIVVYSLVAVGLFVVYTRSE